MTCSAMIWRSWARNLTGLNWVALLSKYLTPPHLSLPPPFPTPPPKKKKTNKKQKQKQNKKTHKNKNKKQHKKQAYC